MNEQLSYDVFLSHSSKDLVVVRGIAERLRADGVRVWLDDWEIRPGDSIPAKIEHGLESSRVLVLCMSAHAFGSDWAQLESGTFRFRDPLNKERRFIPLRLDDAPLKGFLAQFHYINWLADDREAAYQKLLEACRSGTEPAATTAADAIEQAAEGVVQLEAPKVRAYVFSLDGTRALVAVPNSSVQLFDLKTGQALRTLQGHSDDVWGVAWSADQRQALSTSWDQTVRLWDVETEHCVRVLKGHSDRVNRVVWSGNRKRAISSADDLTVRLWDLDTGRCLQVFEGHTEHVYGIAESVDQLHILSSSNDRTVRLWDVATGRCLRVFDGHTHHVNCVAWSPDSRYAVSGASDPSVRVWEVNTGRCLSVLEGHLKNLNDVAWSSNPAHVLSGGNDDVVRLWDVETGNCLRILKRHEANIRKVHWSADGRRAVSGDTGGLVCFWDLSKLARKTDTPQTAAVSVPATPNRIQYTNAKVLLVGDSGVGKTGLSKRLALDAWQPSDSTVGAWATQWKLPVSSGDNVEREIWLWDFGGQADQRLIHQLYMDETAMAVMVFDGQKDDLFETLGQWDRDLTRASRHAFVKLLVAGRVDAGRLRVSRHEIEAFVKERGYLQFLETSAKTNHGCEELKHAILDGIQWEDIPWRSSPLLFKRLKDEIVRLKDAGRVLIRFNELRETLQVRLAGEGWPFTDDELKAVVNLLAGPGVVWELQFGSWVLLQPERINAYAQAVIQTMREDEYERGCLPEERILNGNLTYQSSMERLEPDEERFILLAMHQKLLEHSLCLREHTDNGPLLVFPSYYRRERQDLASAPTVLVSYRFNGFIDDIYATLVVRLHHTKPFTQDRLWRYAADFKTLTNKSLGVKVTRRAEGAGELDVYFDPAIPVEEKIIFSKYIHEHLLRYARSVERLRYYVCPHCGTPVGNREVAMRRLDAWLKQDARGPQKQDEPTIICSECEKRVPLWDDLENHFASDEMKRRVHELDEQAAFVLDNESKERALVGEVISTVALAGQICREKNVSDHGVDMEIEFKDDAGHATGVMLFLQLKSGDSYLRTRAHDGAEIFTIQKKRHADYWMRQKFPVLLVIRSADGQVRWMEVRDYLSRESDKGRKPVRQIVFDGERLDVMSVRRWREKSLASA